MKRQRETCLFPLPFSTYCFIKEQQRTFRWPPAEPLANLLRRASVFETPNNKAMLVITRVKQVIQKIGQHDCKVLAFSDHFGAGSRRHASANLNPPVAKGCPAAYQGQGLCTTVYGGMQDEKPLRFIDESRGRKF
ncbi:hypothetical protein CAPTEDRAFT_195656 [Capitella teleta]|uniref:Uncharacterized protein n=1 Tax=Capitella teleta TaxID=283909 RepID=X1ZVC2_CAPTE|nr:hypothetical protein CAPTEDRAFT_195656 [Capitella teleta]|eukprot:ELT88371.1 hypothetical protein CAPTEDRAFT_195656 [Capitella teleta]